MRLKTLVQELALKSNARTLAPDLGRVTKREEKLVCLRSEYDTNSQPYKEYRSIDNMLAPFLSGDGVQRPVSQYELRQSKSHCKKLLQDFGQSMTLTRECCWHLRPNNRLNYQHHANIY
jgi:hypothetical protein